jgi:RNA polymerase sigma factor (sigma-70 family)
MDPSISAALLARAQDGDAQALETLFAWHVARLRLYVGHRLGRVLGRLVEVDDVVQETHVRALSEVRRIEPAGESAFFRLLCTISRHVIADVARAARARKRSGSTVRLDRSGWSRTGLGESAVAGRVPGPLSHALAAEEARLLERAFAALPARYRRVIVLRQFEQRSARDVAALTRSSEQAVHALYRRALDAWAQQAERLGVGQGE